MTLCGLLAPINAGAPTATVQEIHLHTNRLAIQHSLDYFLGISQVLCITLFMSRVDFLEDENRRFQKTTLQMSNQIAALQRTQQNHQSMRNTEVQDSNGVEINFVPHLFSTGTLALTDSGC